MSTPFCDYLGMTAVDHSEAIERHDEYQGCGSCVLSATNPVGDVNISSGRENVTVNIDINTTRVPRTNLTDIFPK